MRRIILSSACGLVLAACAAQPAAKTAAVRPAACVADAPATGTHMMNNSCRGPVSAADRQAAQDAVMRGSQHASGAPH